MVALTRACAEELDYSSRTKTKAVLHRSLRPQRLRRKSDDLLDCLIVSAQKEVDSRHPELAEAERQETAA